jgi:hypothetical protein
MLICQLLKSQILETNNIIYFVIVLRCRNLALFVINYTTFLYISPHYLFYFFQKNQHQNIITFISHNSLFISLYLLFITIQIKKLLQNKFFSLFNTIFSFFQY